MPETRRPAWIVTGYVTWIDAWAEEEIKTEPVRLLVVGPWCRSDALRAAHALAERAYCDDPMDEGPQISLLGVTRVMDCVQRPTAEVAA